MYSVTLRVLVTINIKVIVNMDVCCGVVTLVHRIAGDDWKGRVTPGQQGRDSRAETSMPEPKTDRQRQPCGHHRQLVRYVELCGKLGTRRVYAHCQPHPSELGALRAAIQVTGNEEK